MPFPIHAPIDCQRRSFLKRTRVFLRFHFPFQSRFKSKRRTRSDFSDRAQTDLEVALSFHFAISRELWGPCTANIFFASLDVQGGHTMSEIVDNPETSFV